MQNKTLKISVNFLKALILPIACYLIFTIGSGGIYGTWATLQNNAIKMVQPVIMAWGLSFIFTAGIWDMSAGGIVVVAAIVAGNLSRSMHMGLAGLVLFAIATALLLSLITAFINYILNVPSMVLTLGLLLIYETFTYFLFSAKGTYLMGNMAALGKTPFCFILLAVALAIVVIIWRYTKIAHHIKAVGSNSDIARNIGIHVKKTQFKAIMIGGFFYGISSVSYASNIGNVEAVLNMSSMTLVFNAMMGMFIGMSLQKYVSLPVGIIIGTLTMQMLGTGLLSFGLDSNLQNVFMGAFLLIFMMITINQNRIFEARDAKKRLKIAKGKLSGSN